MSTEQPLLSPEEIAALTDASHSSGESSSARRASKSEVRPIDLFSEDSSLGVNVSALDMINERFIRLFRLGMLELLRSNPRLSPARVQIIRFGDYLRPLKPPMSVNTIRMTPLRGQVLVVIEPSVIFSALDSFFGGFGRGVTQLSPGRLFTPTESRIVKLILSVFFRSMGEAWSPVTPVEFEHVSSEINPQFAQIADENDRVVVSRFEADHGQEGFTGFVDLVIPYVALKAIRDQLRGRVRTGDGDAESERLWQRQLHDAVSDASVPVKVVLGTLDLSLSELGALQIGDLLYFNKHDPTRMLIHDNPVFDVEVGNLGSTLACRILDSIKPNTRD
jgi:flagellar motor switch protein FliM